VTLVTGARRARIGLLGGTFDPPHIGHLVAAVSVGEALALDEVWLVPNGDPWQKRDRPVSGAGLRLSMTAAAVDGVPGLAVSDVEVRRPGPSFTVDTVAELRAEDPERDLVVIMGRDSALGLPTWERHEELLASVAIAVVDRALPVPGAPVPALPDLPGARIEVVPMRRIDVSSTELRRRVAEGRPIIPLVPAAVADLIARHGLYRSDAPS
jgi:nicotinate-nucleotide adenylyltransferase